MTGDKEDRLTDTVLSESEAAVAARRVEGKTFHDIADDLDMSPQSANTHWQRSKRKAAEAKDSVAVFRDVGLID